MARRVDEDLALDAIFRDQGAGEPPHAILFGEPGSGKTTALRTLHRLACDPDALGLDADTLPVFFRLRCFTSDLLEMTLGEVLGRELRDVSGERLPAGLGEELWARGRLLLLFDGLDEIGDEAHRARVLRRLAWLLEGVTTRGIRPLGGTGGERFSSGDLAAGARGSHDLRADSPVRREAAGRSPSDRTAAAEGPRKGRSQELR